MGDKTEIHISQSTLGILNTGEIKHVQRITANVQALAASGQPDLAQALKELTEAFTESKEIGEDQRKEALELLEDVSDQAAQPPEKRSRSGVIKAVLDSLSNLAGTATSLEKAWAAWEPHLRQFFGL